MFKQKIANLIKYSLRFRYPLPRQLMNGYMEWHLLANMLQDMQINIVLDVGANEGQFAFNLRRIGYYGQIYSFEPVQSAYNKLSARFTKDKQWTGFNYALGSKIDEHFINVPQESTAMSSLLQPSDGSWQIDKQMIQIKTLDSLFDDLVKPLGSPRVFLKIDTQGYDIEVIKGAKNSLPHILCLQSEIANVPMYDSTPSYLDALNLYESFGFRLSGLTEISRINGQVAEMNCLMIKTDARSSLP